MTTSPTATGPSIDLLLEINTALFRDAKILNKDTYWKLVEKQGRL